MNLHEVFSGGNDSNHGVNLVEVRHVATAFAPLTFVFLSVCFMGEVFQVCDKTICPP